jgi:hypothetical protein
MKNNFKIAKIKEKRRHNSTYAQWPMKEHFETAVPHRKFVAGDNDKARKMAIGHNWETYCTNFKKPTATKWL